MGRLSINNRHFEESTAERPTLPATPPRARIFRVMTNARHVTPGNSFDQHPVAFPSDPINVRTHWAATANRMKLVMRQSKILSAVPSQSDHKEVCRLFFRYSTLSDKPSDPGVVHDKLLLHCHLENNPSAQEEWRTTDIAWSVAIAYAVQI